MKAYIGILIIFFTIGAQAQDITVIKNNPATPVKNQSMTGTCWCFSTTSLIESECLRKGLPALDLSEMFTVRNIYIEKAKNYIHRQGFARFDEGGLGHDVIHAAATYGIMPESVYSGLKGGQTQHDHGALVAAMKSYLDSVLKVNRPIPDNWQAHLTAILDQYLGAPPATFIYNGRTYTPLTFAKEVVKFNPDDFVNLTSFSDHPFYKSFIVEVPDNFSNGAYLNIPLNEMISIVKTALAKGYTVLWDADVSNKGWMTGKGYALFPTIDTIGRSSSFSPDTEEKPFTQNRRQQLYEELITEDDHLMHITGIGKSKEGKDFFIVKNSWGEKSGPFSGYMNVSIPYFAINTVTIIVPKAALDKAVSSKLAAD
ncbi:bleomycin hydrolase [Chitinophaga sp. CF118]|uniref:C1 family peptidase n=1 Tax=Chitinophaga sp. CF118 TaxID=1884367 RepID=UPI0008F0BFEE|nr:C1 family peptidase [Chitinophaga sp. CF118]SFE87885.1 bleomycin hydrolase [Chitinophaga sp. CF118]